MRQAFPWITMQNIFDRRPRKSLPFFRPGWSVFIHNHYPTINPIAQRRQTFSGDGAEN